MNSRSDLRAAAILLLAVCTGAAACSPSDTKQEHDNGSEAVQAVTSKDGTRIAYDRVGEGPALILVHGALVTRAGHAELAQLLAPHFTVYNYDRRGRGTSTDTQPYAVEREIEDIEALIERAGGSAHVYGISSGASLALEAAAALGDRVNQLALYEAPYDDAEVTAVEWQEYSARLHELIAADRRGDALTLFMQMVGTPDEAIAAMRATPAWAEMEAIAPTMLYDMAVVGNDRSVPVDRAARVRAATLVMDGGASLETAPSMRRTAETLAAAIPNARRRTIEGQAHDVSSEVLAPVLVEFFSGRQTAAR